MASWQCEMYKDLERSLDSQAHHLQNPIPSPISDLGEDATVDMLMLARKQEWDLSLLQQSFSFEETSIIFAIPLSIIDRADKIFWAHTSNGNH